MTNPPPPRLSGEEKHIVFTYNRLAHRFGDEWQDVSQIEADNRPYEIIQAWRHLTSAEHRAELDWMLHHVLARGIPLRPIGQAGGRHRSVAARAAARRRHRRG